MLDKMNTKYDLSSTSNMLNKTFRFKEAHSTDRISSKWGQSFNSGYSVYPGIDIK